MARKTFYIGSQGPYLYDEGAPTADGKEVQAAFTTEGHLVSKAVPTQLDHAVRLEDIEGAISANTFTQAGQLLVALGSGAFTTVPPPNSDDLVLTSDLSLPSRMKWAEPPAGGGGDGGGTGGGAGIFIGAKGFVNGQTIPSGVFTKVEFSEARFDEGGLYDGDRLIAPFDGKYIIVGNVGFSSYNSDDWLVGSICVNGGLPYPFMSTNPNTVQTPVFTGVVVLELKEGDYVQLFVRQNSGVSKNLRDTSLTMVMLMGAGGLGASLEATFFGGSLETPDPEEPIILEL
jgi:hypothetical protein